MEDNTTQLENLIRDYIKFWYEAEYTGFLKVIKNPPTYTWKIGLPSYMVPTTITIDCDTDEEFLNYIYSEIRSRNYIRLEIYKVTRNMNTREE